ncbi:MAG: GDP-mannose 4,6-dehydratase [Mariprofundaceae bacterium]
MGKRALITGVTGQDGAYLAKLLLEKGYEVYGAYRRSATVNPWRLEWLGVKDQVKMVPFDLLEFTNILRCVDQVAPDEVYNLAAQSFVGLSFEQPVYTSDVDGMGVLRLLEVIRTVNKDIRLYQASTSEMFGKVQATPQNEQTPFYPRSPYGVAKLYAHWMCINYREAYDIHTSAGILFNHESPLRGLEFVTRKVTAALARIRNGEDHLLELGNMDAKRDWGFAGDYVEGMWSMVQQPVGDAYVLATGEAYSVREFVDAAAHAMELDLVWEGEGEGLHAIDRKTNRTLVRVNPEFYRPTEVDLLIGDASKARQELGWQSNTSFETLVAMMAQADLDWIAEG